MLLRMFLGCLLFCAIAPVHAIKLIPLTATLYIDEQLSQCSFRISNPASQPAAVQVSVYLRTTEVDGTERRSQAKQWFTIFPEQMVVMPGETQTVRVQWLDPHPVTNELPFRIIAEQLAVDFNRTPNTATSVILLMRYEGMLYLQSSVTTSANIEVVGAEYRLVGNQQRLQLTVRNSGGRHLVLKNPQITLSNNQDTVVLDKAANHYLNVNFLAGETRQFSLPWPSHFDHRHFNAKLNFDPPE